MSSWAPLLWGDDGVPSVLHPPICSHHLLWYKPEAFWAATSHFPCSQQITYCPTYLHHIGESKESIPLLCCLLNCKNPTEKDHHRWWVCLVLPHTRGTSSKGQHRGRQRRWWKWKVCNGFLTLLLGTNDRNLVAALLSVGNGPQETRLQLQYLECCMHQPLSQLAHDRLINLQIQFPQKSHAKGTMGAKNSDTKLLGNPQQGMFECSAQQARKPPARNSNRCFCTSKNFNGQISRSADHLKLQLKWTENWVLNSGNQVLKLCFDNFSHWNTNAFLVAASCYSTSIGLGQTARDNSLSPFHSIVVAENILVCMEGRFKPFSNIRL